MNNLTYEQALFKIRQSDNFSQKPSLDRIKKVLSAFSNPQNSYEILHLVGTNGKGSITSMTANILQNAGYKVGKFISPFVYNFGERISINSVQISPEKLSFYVEKIQNITESIENVVLSEFEFITVIAFLYFKDEHCDFVCLEAGMGGEFDGTNAIDSPLLSVVTKISLDHTNILGSDITEIAKTKCKVIKNSTCVSYPLQNEEVLPILNSYNVVYPDISNLKIISCDILGSEIEYNNQKYKISLIGEHQIYNAVTVIEICNQLICKNIKIHNDNIIFGLSNTIFEGRMEILSTNPLIIFDGAHNFDGILALENNIKILLQNKKLSIIMAMMKDKDCKKSVETMSRLCDTVIFTKTSYSRCELPENLIAFSTGCGKSFAINSPNDALKKALCIGNDAIIICGTLYLADEIKNMNLTSF